MEETTRFRTLQRGDGRDHTISDASERGWKRPHDFGRSQVVQSLVSPIAHAMIFSTDCDLLRNWLLAGWHRPSSSLHPCQELGTASLVVRGFSSTLVECTVLIFFLQVVDWGYGRCAASL